MPVIIMLFIYLIYILLNYYIYVNLYNIIKVFINNKKTINIIKWVLFALIFTLSFLALGVYIVKLGYISSFLRDMGNLYFCLFLYLLIIFIVNDFIKIFLKLIKKNSLLENKKLMKAIGIINILLAFIIVFYGAFNASRFVIKEYNIKIDKKSEISNLKIALITDTHIGHNITSSYIKNVVNEINKSKSDIVLIGGDLIDNPKEEIDNIDEYIDAIKSIKSTYGVYGILGNHDVMYDGGEKAKEIYKKANVKLLMNESITFDNKFNLIAKSSDSIIPTYENATVVDSANKSIPTIVMIHEPTNIKEYFNKNIDLLVAGHTHNGQIFPGNILCKLIYYNAYGLKEYNNLYSIVSSGVGYWGPRLKIGANNEIVYINLSFN